MHLPLPWLIVCYAQSKKVVDNQRIDSFVFDILTRPTIHRLIGLNLNHLTSWGRTERAVKRDVYLLRINRMKTRTNYPSDLFENHIVYLSLLFNYFNYYYDYYHYYHHHHHHHHRHRHRHSEVQRIKLILVLYE